MQDPVYLSLQNNMLFRKRLNWICFIDHQNIDHKKLIALQMPLPMV